MRKLPRVLWFRLVLMSMKYRVKTITHPVSFDNHNSHSRWPTSITAYSGQEYEIEYTEEGEMVEVSRGNEVSITVRI